MPGLPESIAVSKFPHRAKLVFMVVPAPGVNQCFVGDFACAGGEVGYVPGTPRRTSGKGRALVQILPPGNYRRQKPGGRAETFLFMTGDRVLIEAFASRRDRRHDRIVVGFASSPATMMPPTQ